MENSFENYKKTIDSEDSLRVNETVYGPDIKEIIKRHDIALEQGKIYHRSIEENLNTLIPSIPAEEIKNGKLIWQIDESLSEESKTVCFAADIEKNFEFNPMIKGFIYKPKNTEGFRKFYAEAAELDEWLDSFIVGEVRAYHPVEVEKVGEFKMIPTDKGLRPKIKWY